MSLLLAKQLLDYARGQKDKARFAGLWTHKLTAPVKVLDPEKMLALLPIPVRMQQKIESGFLPVSNLRVITSRLVEREDVRGLNLLEKIIQGGGVKWQASYENLVVNEGLDHLLDVTLSGGSQDTSWFVGLLASSPSPAAGWTATEIASNDFVNYDETTLQAWTDGGVSSQSVSNSASQATFTIDTDSSTIGGAFLIGTNAKATPAGTLYAAGAFSGGNKSADDDDTLDVTATFTSAAA